MQVVGVLVLACVIVFDCVCFDSVWWMGGWVAGWWWVEASEQGSPGGWPMMTTFLVFQPTHLTTVLAAAHLPLLATISRESRWSGKIENHGRLDCMNR
jgi:hypothetical protein